MIHGGGWFRGDKSKETALAERLTTDGFLVVAPNYRLAPDHLFPAAMDDLLKVYDWLAASDYPVKGKITALGSSSGGNLSIELALQRGFQQLPGLGSSTSMIGYSSTQRLFQQ